MDVTLHGPPISNSLVLLLKSNDQTKEGTVQIWELRDALQKTIDKKIDEKGGDDDDIVNAICVRGVARNSGLYLLQGKGGLPRFLEQMRQVLARSNSKAEMILF